MYHKQSHCHTSNHCIWGSEIRYKVDTNYNYLHKLTWNHSHRYKRQWEEVCILCSCRHRCSYKRCTLDRIHSYSRIDYMVVCKYSRNLTHRSLDRMLDHMYILRMRIHMWHLMCQSLGSISLLFFPHLFHFKLDMTYIKHTFLYVNIINTASKLTSTWNDTTTTTISIIPNHIHILTATKTSNTTQSLNSITMIVISASTTDRSSSYTSSWWRVKVSRIRALTSAETISIRRTLIIPLTQLAYVQRSQSTRFGRCCVWNRSVEEMILKD